MRDLPSVVDCKPGLWAELSNGWIVGPIVATGFDGIGIYVSFNAPDSVWQLDVMGQTGVAFSSPRLVIRVGTKRSLMGLDK